MIEANDEELVKSAMISTFYDSEFPILHIDSILFLREQIDKDIKAFFDYYTDPEVTNYILSSNPKNIAEAAAEINYCRDLFRYKRGIYWALARKEDNHMIGAIGLYINNQHHRAEICYDLSRHYWNRGIMTKALQIVIDFCFNRIALNRIEALTLKENTASISTLNKSGFVHEGSLKNYRYYNELSHDIEIFSIIPTLSTQT